VLGATVCQWSHNCVKGESWQIPDRPHLSGVGFYRKAPKSLSACGVCIYQFTFGLLFN
jgi:hypothetical protein